MISLYIVHLTCCDCSSLLVNQRWENWCSWQPKYAAMATMMFSWWLRWWWWRWRWTYCQNHFDGRKEPMRPIWLLHCPKRGIKPRTSNCSLAYLRQRDSVRLSEKSTFFPRCGEVPVHAHFPGKSKLVVPSGSMFLLFFRGSTMSLQSN